MLSMMVMTEISIMVELELEHTTPTPHIASLSASMFEFNSKNIYAIRKHRYFDILTICIYQNIYQ